jgi:hypothetical protein
MYNLLRNPKHAKEKFVMVSGIRRTRFIRGAPAFLAEVNQMAYYYVPRPPVPYTVYVPQQCYTAEQRLAPQPPEVFYQPPPQYYCYQPPANMYAYQPPAQVYQPPTQYYFQQAPAQAYAYQPPAVRVSEYGGYCGYGGLGGLGGYHGYGGYW